MDREEKRSTMRCLYCGEPLSLLRKLTGKAEFCSEAHREAYQQEFNSLALQRLAAQPKHNRRPESVPPPAPIEAAPVAPAEVPFAGLPFPEDADELELPVFDSPIFAATQTQVDAPVDEAVAPASLWVLLSCPSLPALGALPPSYSFSVGLAGYPRDCMMTAGPVAPHAGHAFPDAGYVDLPSAMGEESLAIALVDAEPLVAYFQSCALPPRDPISLTPRQIGQPDALFVFDAALSDAGHRTELPPSTCPPTPLAASLRLAYPWLVAVNPEAQLASPPLAVIQELPEPFLPAFETQPSSDASMPLQPPVAPVDLSGVTSRVTAPDRAPDLHPHCSAAEVWPGCSTEAPPEECEIPTLIESFDVDRSLIVSEFQPASLLPSLATASLVTFDGAIPAAPFERQPDAPPQPQSTFTRFDRLCTVPSFASAPSLILPRAGSFPTPPPRAESAFSDDSPAALYVPFAAPPAQLALTFAAAAGSPGWVALPDGAPASSPDIHPRSGDQLPVKPVTTTWEAFPCSGSLAQPALANHCLDRRWPSETGLASHVLALHTPAHGDTPDNAPKPVASPDWLHAPLPLSSRAFSARVRPASSLSQVRITDFAWPQFAAGCDSLFTPDQPFRFHEMSFPHRGTTDMAVGEALGGSMQLIVPPGQGHSMWTGFFKCQELVDFVITTAKRSNASPQAPAQLQP